MEDNNYGIPLIEQTDVCCQRCGSMNIQYQREYVGTTGAANTKSKTRYVSSRKLKGKINTVTTNTNLYQTVAICKNCGNTWITAAAIPAKPEKKKGEIPHGTLILVCAFIVLFLIFAIITVSRNGNKDTTAAVQANISIAESIEQTE